jgi:uncharacterized protein (TIGR02246 family)
MRRAWVLACLAAALPTWGLVVRGQDRAPDVSAVVVPLAERESAAFAKAFNDRKIKDLAALFTPDADFAFLQGPSVEKLEYGMARGRDEIASCIDTFGSTFPDAKLTSTVLSARLIRPDLLIAEVDFAIKGLPKGAGPIQGRAVTVRVLESGAWKIAAERSFSKTPLIRHGVRAQDLSAVVVPPATRESAAFTKAFNDRQFKDLAAQFTSDADFAFLQGPSVEKLQYGMARGRDEIVNSIETFCSVFPDARLTRKVLSARLIQPDVLTGEVEFEIRGLPKDAGPIRGRAMTVRVLESGRWKIAAERNLSRTPVTK